MAVVLSPPHPSTDILPSILNRYFSPKSPSRSWLVPHQDDEAQVETTTSLRGVDIAHAYTTTCTAIDGPERTPNDLRVMHRMDDGFALGTAAALDDKLLPYSKDPLVGSHLWSNMKWRRFATDLKVSGRCEYIEVGQTENGRFVLTAFVIQEGVDGALDINADVLYYEDDDVLSNSRNGRDAVENAGIRVSLRGIGQAKVCRYCATRGMSTGCRCSEQMRKRCGMVPSSVNVNPKKQKGGQHSEGSTGTVVAHGSSGLTLWDQFLERQRTLDRVATVTYTVYKDNEPLWVGPFNLRLVYGRTNDTRRMASVFLHRTTKSFRWARLSPSRKAKQITSHETQDVPKRTTRLENGSPGTKSPLLLEGFSSTEEVSSVCVVQEQADDFHYHPKFEMMSSLAPHAVSLVTDSATNNSVPAVTKTVAQDGRSKGNKRFACHLCQNTFVSRGHLSRHHRSVHERKPALPCDYCDREFREESHRAHHMAVVHTDRRRTDGASEQDFRCLQCGYAFVRKYTLLRHIKLVHDRHRVKCPICGREFGQRCDLKRHVLRVHDGDGLDGIAKAEMVRAS